MIDPKFVVVRFESMMNFQNHWNPWDLFTHWFCKGRWGSIPELEDLLEKEIATCRCSGLENLDTTEWLSLTGFVGRWGSRVRGGKCWGWLSVSWWSKYKQGWWGEQEGYKLSLINADLKNWWRARKMKAISFECWAGTGEVRLTLLWVCRRIRGRVSGRELGEDTGQWYFREAPGKSEDHPFIFPSSPE